MSRHEIVPMRGRDKPILLTLPHNATMRNVAPMDSSLAMSTTRHQGSESTISVAVTPTVTPTILWVGGHALDVRGSRVLHHYQNRVRSSDRLEVWRLVVENWWLLSSSAPGVHHAREDSYLILGTS